MGTQLVLSFAKRYFFNLSNALNSKHNSQTIRILSPYRNISLFSFVFILESFEDILKPIFREQENLEQENTNLATLRDTLLPKLMNGEIKV